MLAHSFLSNAELQKVRLGRRLGVVALRCEVQSSHQHQDLKLHSAIHDIEAVFGMHHRDGTDHDDHDNQTAHAREYFLAEGAGNQRYAGSDFCKRQQPEIADGGTLFLDEVGEIPMSQQGKLLRALQEGEFERVGDDKSMKVDVRVVAATNRNLMDEIKAGRFREDLFYRLSVFPLEVPPLRDRLNDVAPLAFHFLEGICRELGREPLRMTQSHLAILKRHEWPGNIRELKNVIERAVISSTGSRLRLDLALPNALVEKPVTTQPLPAESPEFVTIAEFQELEKANLIAALQCANWKVWGPGGAADLLAMKPSTLTYQMKTLGVAKQRAEATNLPEKP